MKLKLYKLMLANMETKKMTKKQKERIFRATTKALIKDANKLMLQKLDKVFESGAFDVQEYELNYLLPKAILVALAKEVVHQYSPRGCSFDKKCKKLSNQIFNAI